jgi:spermidine/putrescine-binding protein
MTTKPVLTNEEVVSLNKYLAVRGSKEEAVKHYVQTNQLWTSSYKPLREMGLEKFIQVLFFGYEKEKTPEEKVKALWDEEVKQGHIYTLGIIENVLSELNIKIEGVNK